MRTWWKQHKWSVLVPVILAVVLVVAYWYGGDAPGLHGWEAEPSAQTQTDTPQETPEPTQEEAPAEEPSEDPGEAEDKPDESTAPAEEEKPEPSANSNSQGMVIDPKTGKDQYQTDPVPAGKPLPQEPQETVKTETTSTCTVSISCASVLAHLDRLDAEKRELIPEDGVILAPTTVTFHEGESAFDVLKATCQAQGIHMEFSNTPVYNSAYIEGIQNLYEFDCGELSGWMYRVNDWFPNYGCSRYLVQAGDSISWLYTCELGADIGGSNAAGGSDATGE